MEQGQKRSSFFDMLKGICIIFVLINHFIDAEDQELKIFFPYWGDMAVPLFMILSGYLYAESYKRNKIESFSQAYEFSFVLKKVFRFAIPFFLLFIVEMMLERGYLGTGYSLFEMAMLFLRGGNGPGGYYIPMLIQFIFLFPVIYFIIRRKKNGILICLALNIAYEVIKTSFGMNVEFYRLCLFRFLFAIAAGCFLSLRQEEKIKPWYYAGFFAVGAVAIYISNYTDYHAHILYYWTKTTIMTVFYIFPIFVLLKSKMEDIREPFFSRIGMASYHIFLVQKLYYRYFSEQIAVYVHQTGLCLLTAIAVCCAVGIIFWKIEEPVSRKVIALIK